MKRTSRILTISSLVVASSLATAAPAIAQDYGGGDAAVGTFVLCCYGIILLLGLAGLVLWVWMLIDVLQRQEYEFPNSTGNSKTMWLVIMGVSFVIGASLIAAIIYYFMVYKKVRRGSVPPPGGGFGTPTGVGAPPPPAAPTPPPGAGSPPPPPAPPGGGTPPPPPPPQ